MYGNIRQTSRALGLATEASMRYSKGVDAVNTEYALHRACQLVEELGAGEVVGGEIDLLCEDLKERQICTTVDQVNGLLGAEISGEEMKQPRCRLLLALAEMAQAPGDRAVRERLENQACPPSGCLLSAL